MTLDTLSYATIMGLCYTKEHQFRQPVLARTIDHSDISSAVRLESNCYTDIQKYYRFKRVLGHGHFGTVREATHLSDPSKRNYAVKSIPKEKIVKELKLMKRELELLRLVDHPNIIKFYETFEDERYVHIVMEELSGGDLFDHLIANGQYTEREAATLLEKIISAINHLHASQICHRDIKPENFLYTSSDKAADVKIIDFGLATKFGEEMMHTVVGTPYYVAPEVLRGNYDRACDVWSLGVLLYVLLAGYPPFNGDTQHEIFHKITHGEFDFDRDEWDDVSTQGKSMISSMLILQPDKRATLDQILKHDWFRMHREQGTKPQVPLRILDKLTHYKAPKRLKQEALKVVVKLLSNDQIDELRVRYRQQAFEAIDTERTGFLTMAELQNAMEQAGLHIAKDEISRIFYLEIVNKVDYLHQGKLNYTEFVLATLDRKKIMTDEIIFNAFKYFDPENTGFITPSNLANAFQHAGYEISSNEVTEMIKEYDVKYEYKIDFDEFSQLLCKC